MAVYRLILNGRDTGQTVNATSKMDAYSNEYVSDALRLGAKVQLRVISDPNNPELGSNVIDIPSDLDEFLEIDL